MNGKRKKGLGKESDLLFFSEIIFEGEYLNGEIWNGKGKNFFKNSQLKTYFEYLNGKLWNMKQYDINNNIINEIINGKGSIKLYHYNGNLRIEEYLNGERNGKCKEYNIEGNIIHECEYLNGKKTGKEKVYNYKGELKKDCEYLNDKIWNGYIKEYFKDGLIKAEKEYINGKLWKIQIYDKNNRNIKYELINGNGFGVVYDYDDKLIFEGEYLNGVRNGKGKEYYNNGKLKYEGEYLNGKRSGIGKEYINYRNFPSIAKFEGEHLNGERNGKV